MTPAEFHAEVQRRHSQGESVQGIATALRQTYQRVWASCRRTAPARDVDESGPARLRFLVAKGLIP